MMEQEQLQEVEQLGETLPQPPPRIKSKLGCGLLLAQVTVCVLLLFGLVAVKFADPARFAKLSLWYHTEISREIELPQFSAPSQASAQAVQVC